MIKCIQFVGWRKLIQPTALDYIMDVGHSSDYKYGSTNGIGDVFHNAIYDMASQAGNKYFSQYNKLRKQNASAGGFPSCGCK